MQVHETAVKELQEQLGQKAITVSSLHQETQQLQQQLSEERSHKTALKQNLQNMAQAHNSAAEVLLSQHPALPWHCFLTVFVPYDSTLVAACLSVWLLQTV